jgi:membrane protease YdiL (CAAX protease family)
VIAIFVGSLVLWVVAMVALKLGASEAKVDVFASGVFAVMAIVCVASAPREIGALLGRTGGARGVAAALAAFGFLVAFGSLYFPAFRWLGFSYERISDQYLEAGWPRWTPYALAALSPAVLEEIIFRGYVMARLDRLLTARESLLVQAALFSLLHLGVVIFPSHFVIGLVLGVLRRRTGSLYPGIAVHMSWNAIIVFAEMSGRIFM